jgi:hypothetical protein
MFKRSAVAIKVIPLLSQGGGGGNRPVDKFVCSVNVLMGTKAEHFNRIVHIPSLEGIG